MPTVSEVSLSSRAPFITALRAPFWKTLCTISRDTLRVQSPNQENTLAADGALPRQSLILQVETHCVNQVLPVEAALERMNPESLSMLQVETRSVHKSSGRFSTPLTVYLRILTIGDGNGGRQWLP